MHVSLQLNTQCFPINIANTTHDAFSKLLSSHNAKYIYTRSTECNINITTTTFYSTYPHSTHLRFLGNGNKTYNGNCVCFIYITLRQHNITVQIENTCSNAAVRLAQVYDLYNQMHRNVVVQIVLFVCLYFFRKLGKKFHINTKQLKIVKIGI